MNASAQFDYVDVELLRKYDKPGPRYTSYPTAPNFSKEFGPADYEGEIVRTNSSGKGDYLSLYFHLPFCKSLCYFCACNMQVTHSREAISDYLAVLKAEIDLISKLIDPRRKVVQLHWGGGTPTYLSPQEIRDLMGHIRSRFSLGETAEMGVEIDPRGLTAEHIEALRESGFNRASIGVQDFDPEVQETVNRIQPEEMTRSVFGSCRRLGFTSINLDLIYGLPRQTLESFEWTIDKVIEISPDRLAVFNFAYVPWIKKHHERLIDPATLPKPEAKLAILKMTIEKLSQASYVYIGMDHFARQDDELAVAQREGALHRNFQGYSTKAGFDLYGMGVSSISCVGDVYAQNHKAIPDYKSAALAGRLATMSGYRVSEDDKVRWYVITRLMCDMELAKGDVERRFGIDFDTYFADALTQLTPFEADGLLVHEKDKIEVAGTGRLVIRNIAMAFDKYLKKETDGRPVFSRTV